MPFGSKKSCRMGPPGPARPSFLLDCHLLLREVRAQLVHRHPCARSPKLVFEACQRDVGVDVVRCGLPPAHRAAGPEGCCEAVLPESVAVRGAAGTRRFRWPRCWTWASAAGTRVGRLCAEPRGRDAAAERMDDAWPEGEAKLSVNAMMRSTQQQQAGRRGRGLLSSLRLRGGHGAGPGCVFPVPGRPVSSAAARPGCAGPWPPCSAQSRGPRRGWGRRRCSAASWRRSPTPTPRTSAAAARAPRAAHGFACRTSASACTGRDC